MYVSALRSCEAHLMLCNQSPKKTRSWRSTNLQATKTSYHQIKEPKEAEAREVAVQGAAEVVGAVEGEVAVVQAALRKKGPTRTGTKLVRRTIIGKVATIKRWRGLVHHQRDRKFLMDSQIL